MGLLSPELTQRVRTVDVDGPSEEARRPGVRSAPNTVFSGHDGMVVRVVDGVTTGVEFSRLLEQHDFSG